MIDFLVENWKLFVIIGAILIDLLACLIFKKRSQIVDNSILVKVCYWISEAEAKFRIGSDKLNYVLEQAKSYLGDNFCRKDIENLVEFVLTLPEKKVKK